MGYNDLSNVKKRLQLGVSKLNESEIRLLFFDIYNQLEELKNEQANGASGSDPVPGAEDPKPGTGKRGRPRKSDAARPEEGGDA